MLQFLVMLLALMKVVSSRPDSKVDVNIGISIKSKGQWWTQECGVPIQPLPSHRNRIIDGQDAPIEAIPWQAAIYYIGTHPTNFTQKHFFRCGGAILSPRFVMTASHCFKPHEFNPYKFGVMVGKSNWEQLDRRELYWIRTVHFYPSFDLNNRTKEVPRYDYAIVELWSKIPLTGSSLARAVCLPESDDPILEPGTQVVVSGWGYKNATVTPVEWPIYDLQYREIPIVGRSECQEIYDADTTVNTTREVWDNEICAGDLENGGYGGGCMGDSGGPLTWMDPATSTYKLFAVASWGENCGEKPGIKYYPGRYAKIDYALQWIKDIVNMK